jgi:hypothetical protein
MWHHAHPPFTEEDASQVHDSLTVEPQRQATNDGWRTDRLTTYYLIPAQCPRDFGLSTSLGKVFYKSPFNLF